MDNHTVADTIIGRMKNEHKEIANHLLQSGLISLSTTTNNIFAKVALFSAASYCESRMTETLIKFYEDMCEERSFLAEFVKNQAIGYRYSQLFAWKEGNANRFFGLFGSDFKEYMKTEIDADNNLKKSIEAFVELGRLRNQAIHENLITFSLIKSTNEIFDRYDEAKLFVEKFPTIVSRYIEQSKT